MNDKRNIFSTFFSDYILYWIDATRNNLKGRPIGGCLFGFKKIYKTKFSLKFCNFEYGVTLFGKFGDKSFHFIPQYLNCNTWMNDFDRFKNLLNDIKDSSFCVIGDLNARVGDSQIVDKHLILNCPLISSSRKSKDLILDTKGRKILQLFEDIGGIIVNGRICSDVDGDNTFCGVMGKSMIDYCVCSPDVLELVCDFTVGIKPFSDHFPLCFSLSTNLNSIVKEMLLPPKLHWSERNATRYFENLRKICNNQYLESNISIDEKVNICISKIRTSSSSNFNPKRFDPKQPWFDSMCENARKKMLKKLDTYRKTDLDFDRLNYLEYKRKYAQLCEEKKIAFCNKNIVKLNNVRNSSDWWKIVNSMKKCPPRIGNNLQIEALYDHFYALFNSQVQECSISWALGNIVDPFLDSPFESWELKYVLKELKLNKSPGLDRVGYEFFKFSPTEFHTELLILFNQIFLKEDIPASFRCSIIVPLHKKGDVNNPANYRGLSLLDSIYKIFTGILLNRLNEWVDFNNIINEFQAGFRKGYSTVDNLFNLTSIVSLNFNLSKKTYAFFVDFSAAFDMIPRNSLFYKLSRLGLSRKMIVLLQKLYENTTSQIWDGNCLSKHLFVEQGVKQGCLLSPLLFTLFLNDLNDFLPGGVTIANTVVKVLKYADDIVLLSDSPSTLQIMINSLHIYCLQWALKINLDKSKILVFRKSGRLPSNLRWNYGENIIEVVNDYKYLGVTLNFNLSFKKHLQSRLILAKNSINSSWLDCIHNQKITCSNKMKIFEAASQSILLYGAQVWGFMRFDEVEKLLRYFLKKMLYLPKNTPNYMLHIETGIPSLFITTLRLHLSYIRKVLKFSNNRLPKILAEETIRTKCFWFIHWDNFYSSANIPLNNEMLYEFNHHQQILEVLLTQEHESFLNAARSSQLHDLYPFLDHKPVSYFTDNVSPYMFSIILKTRGGLLNLNTHLFNINSSNYCNLCNTNSIENTVHFIGICPIFRNMRVRFFHKPELNLSEVYNILNGPNYFLLYQYVINALKYRSLIISEYA